MASRGVQRTYTEKQALKQQTKKIERQKMKAEGRRRDFASDIESNNAATSGHADEPIPTRPNSRSAVADERRAAEKGAGVMSLSKKRDPALKVAGVRKRQSRRASRSDGAKTSRAAGSASKGLDKGSVRTGGLASGTRRKSNAEIAEGVTTTARKSPAPRSAKGSTPGASTGAPRAMDKRTGSARQRMPAPGNVVSVPKGRLGGGDHRAAPRGERPTSSTGGTKPPKRPARAGKASGAAKSKGADMGLER